MEFVGFPKIPRLSRECVVTEKLDGTNASILITEEGEFLTASRKRWIVPGDDNYAFAKWANENKEELMKLGPGHHFGEWWGQGIQRSYGQDRKRFSLFNTSRWLDDEVRPECCDVVPVLYQGLFNTEIIDGLIEELKSKGSAAAPGFMNPEGLIVYHTAGNLYFKKTIEKDESPKSKETK